MSVNENIFDTGKEERRERVKFSHSPKTFLSLPHGKLQRQPTLEKENIHSTALEEEEKGDVNWDVIEFVYVDLPCVCGSRKHNLCNGRGEWDF